MPANTRPFPYNAPPRPIDLRGILRRITNIEPASSPDQPINHLSSPASEQQPKPRQQGWIVKYNRLNRYVFEQSPYTTNTQSQALAIAIHSIKGSLRESVDQCNYYINEVSGLNKRLKELEAMVPDSVSPADPGEASSELTLNHLTQAQREAAFQAMDFRTMTVGSSEQPFSYNEVVANPPLNSGGTPTPEPVTPLEGSISDIPW